MGCIPSPFTVDVCSALHTSRDAKAQIYTTTDHATPGQAEFVVVL